MPLADLFANPRVESQQPKAPSASAQSQATGEGQAKNSGKDREALSGGAGDMRSEPASRVTRIPATVLKTLADRTGMREEEIARRVFEWLTDQDEVVQALVLGLIPEALRDHALKLAIEQLAGRQRRVREAGAA